MIARTSRPRRQRRGYKTSLKRQCDMLCALVVKQRDGYRCTLCGERKGLLDWAHVVSRNYANVRHDLENTTTLCRRCHYSYTLRKDAWDALRRQLMGPAYEALWARALTRAKPDYMAILTFLQWARGQRDLPRPWENQTR